MRRLFLAGFAAFAVCSAASADDQSWHKSLQPSPFGQSSSLKSSGGSSYSYSYSAPGSSAGASMKASASKTAAAPAASASARAGTSARVSQTESAGHSNLRGVKTTLGPRGRNVAGAGRKGGQSVSH